jgi:uncharacterized protein YfcZ (UPF0381/DUF406 family)
MAEDYMDEAQRLRKEVAALQKTLDESDNYAAFERLTAERNRLRLALVKIANRAYGAWTDPDSVRATFEEIEALAREAK